MRQVTPLQSEKRAEGIYSMSENVNYPDILGLITGGDRLNVSVVQAALAVRPQPARSGRAFETVLLLQNAANLPAEVIVSLLLPDQDAKRQKGRFGAKMTKLSIILAPAEVGYVSLPAACHPETAPGAYKIGVELDVKVQGKPARVRAQTGGGTVDPATMPETALKQIEALKKMAFGITKRMGRNIIDVPLEVTLGKPEPMPELKPGWVSVCKLTDYRDDRLLLHAYGETLQVQSLPSFKRANIYKPLVETTQIRFGTAGFPLKEPEAHAIAKLMTIILEFAAPKMTGHGYTNAGVYGVTPLLERDPLTLDRAMMLPHWTRAMLKAIARDERVASHPVQAATRLVYDELLRDSIEYAFELVETATGENLGSPEEMEHYADRVIELLKSGQGDSGLDFNRVYLPLIMGGIIVNDQMLTEKEDPAELLKGISHALEARLQTDPNADPTIVDMTGLLLERTGQKYGYRLN
jgi:hypothetical protein